MADNAKTAPGHLVPTVPEADGPTEQGFGTIQMRTGADVGAPPPIMPTLTGAPIPTGAPPEMPPARYELSEEIARGGMGRVVSATDTVLHRNVALKEALGLDPEAITRFARETRITARLEHPSIVPVHDAGTMPNGAPFYVMRKISGRPLERLVATADTLPERLVLIPHIIAAAHAAAHAHERGIIHRDIKPSNILVGDLGETILIDWGLAKVIGETDDAVSRVPIEAEDDNLKTRAGIVFGTPGFMAPEQLRGAPVNERCDVYALGATLYHLLSRKPPHHAKTADEMMKAAASHAPTPLVDLVEGVPPELSTIVDKALAHDVEERYQSARELAEDLQRFVTGQLVASHHYSPRERIVRFVKKHRIPFMVAGAALIALVIGGAIAVNRVIGERDRADEAARTARAEKKVAEEERAHAEDRLDKLTLSQARSLVKENPTLAVAMVKPLVARHWREVRSIASAARAYGVAWSLPAAKRTTTLQLSHDGRSALAAGEDGVVRLYDLPHRSARVVAELGAHPTAAHFADDERSIVAWQGKELTVLDTATGNKRSTLSLTAPIFDLEVIGNTAYWTDDKRTLWQLDLTGRVPIEITLDERVVQVTPSPNGRWIAIRGERHLMMMDRTQRSTPPAQVLLGTTRDLDWSTDGERFAAIIEVNQDRIEAVIGIAGPEVEIAERHNVGNRQYVAFGPTGAYTIGPMGLQMVPRLDTRPVVGDPVGVRAARERLVVAAGTGGILVLDEHGDHDIKLPAVRIDLVEASPRSPYMLATTERQLLVWNLDEIVPRELASRPAPAFARFAGNGRVIMSFVDQDAQIVEVATGKRVALPAWPLAEAVSSPSGRAICALDVAHHAHLMFDGTDAKDLAGTVDLAGFAGERELLLGNTERGTLELLDIGTNTRSTLVSRPQAKLGEIAWNRSVPAIVAASFSDGAVWRKNLATGSEQLLALGAKPLQLVVAVDGTVLYPEGSTIQAWRPGAATGELQATLPKPIRAIGGAGPGKLVAFVDGGATISVDLAAPETFGEPYMLDEREASMSIETGIFVVRARFGIDVVDPQVRHRWTLASAPGITFSFPQITADGTRILAQTGDALLAWSLAAPSTADETAKWLEAMTNAKSESSGVVWR